MREIKSISVKSVVPDGEQPRKHFEESDLLSLADNMKAIHQQVPIIVYELLAADKNAPQYVIADGERRWRAAILRDILELDAIVLPEKPTAAALKRIQISLAVHHAPLSLMERSDFLARTQNENNWSQGELAANVHMRQPLVSKYLAMQRLCAEVQAMVREGELSDVEKLFVISQEPDAAKQLDLAKLAGLSRDDLRRHARNPPNGAGVEPKASKVSLALPGGGLITLKRRDLTLSGAVELLMGLVKELRRGLSNGLDISTVSRVLADKAKAGKV